MGSAQALAIGTAAAMGLDFAPRDRVIACYAPKGEHCCMCVGPALAPSDME